MKLDPNATQENNFPLLPRGEYDFEVENVTKCQARSGNYYWKVQMRVDPAKGESRKIWDNMTETVANQWKFNQYFASIGFNSDDTDYMPDTIGYVGRALIDVEAGTDGYKDKNVVKRFLPKEVKKKPAKSKDFEDLPF